MECSAAMECGGSTPLSTGCLDSPPQPASRGAVHAPATRRTSPQRDRPLRRVRARHEGKSL